MTELTPAVRLKNMLNNPQVVERFKSILDTKANAFIASIISISNGNANLQKCDPTSIINCALNAATMDLPINPNFGFAYIIPYGAQAQFQIGYKGLIQLALRSGKIKTINVTEVYEGELIESNRFTGSYKFDESQRLSNNVVGFYAYIETINGFEKGEYWSLDKALDHGKKYSKTFKFGQWQENPIGMGKKTVLKNLLSKWVELSIDTNLQRAIATDQAVIKDSESIDVDYVDLAEPQPEQNANKANPKELFNDETTTR